MSYLNDRICITVPELVEFMKVMAVGLTFVICFFRWVDLFGAFSDYIYPFFYLIFCLFSITSFSAILKEKLFWKLENENTVLKLVIWTAGYAYSFVYWYYMFVDDYWFGNYLYYINTTLLIFIACIPVYHMT
jgi:hypothetical protein